MAKKIKSKAQIIKEYLPTPSELIEDFEDTGYLKPQEARELIEATYIEGVIPISKEEFVNMAMKKLEGHHLYKQFIKGEAKMCSKCKNVKPLKSFGEHKDGLYGTDSRCLKCNRDYHKEKYSTDENYKEYKKRKAREWHQENKEHVRETKRIWRENNRDKKNALNKRSRLKKDLIERGFDNITKSALNELIYLKEKKCKPAEDKGLTYSELAFKYNIELKLDISKVDSNNVRKYYKAKEVNITKEEFLRLRAEKKSYKEIGAMYGVRHERIAKIAKELGIDTHKSKYDLNYTDIADYILEGLSYRQIAEKMECSKPYIGKIVNNNGGREAFVEKYKSK